jgi:hypothetical protein
MKMHLVKTLSITLLLSIPCASHALPGDPYDQRTQVNAQIAEIQGTIANLKKQYDAIEPQKTDLALASSQAKGDDKELLAQTGEKIRDLSALAAQTSKLIWAKEAEIKALKETKLTDLAARIATLEPTAEQMETLTKFRASLAGIQGWKKSNFTYCKTTKVPSTEDKSKKVAQPTVTKSDKSAPYFTKEEKPKSWAGSITSGLASATALVYAYPTIKVVTVPAGKALGDTFSFTKITPAASTTTATDTDEKK